MADFLLTDAPAYGVCLTCGTAQHRDGFVDLIAETNIRRENLDIAGNVDIVLCADCITQAARLVGCNTKQEADSLSEMLTEEKKRHEIAADEASAWQQRYENLVEILSLLDLKKNDPGDSVPLGGVEFVPVPDTRVQEGSSEAIQAAREKQRSRRTPRKRTNGSNPGDEGL